MGGTDSQVHAGGEAADGCAGSLQGQRARGSHGCWDRLGHPAPVWAGLSRLPDRPRMRQEVF